jgi:transcriptional regulator with GAF, ATPase, and Fis domain
MATLRIIDGHGKGKAFPLTGQRVTIGRDKDNLIQVGDPKSSRYHAELIWKDDHYLLKDLGSSNGTWNEAGRIDEQRMEHLGVFRIGKTYLRFEDEKAPARGSGASPTIAGEDEGWDDPSNIQSIDPNKSELLRHREMADPRVLERANVYLVLLHQMVLRATEATTRDALFELLDDAAADALEGDRCAVFLPTPDGWSLWPTHERRLRARFGATPFARTLLSEIRRRKEPLLCTIEGDIDPTSSMVQAGVRSAMAAPLRIGDELHALLYVDRLGGGSAFTRTDLEFLAAVANQLAVQLHNRSHVAELEAEVERLQSAPKQAPISLIGEDPQMSAVVQFIRKAGPTEAPILILGESGTGKELVSRALHRHSSRADKPLQIVNCAALAESLVESTLFGHVKGAFTGADETRPGLFELADQGTLFLDEVGELPLPVQAKLLRALEQGEVQRVGDGAVRKVNVRLFAATNRDLRDEVTKGAFREDLFHRLDVLTVTLPPLRNRPSDIDMLIDHFLQENSKRLNGPLKKVSPEARALLLRYPWPGNVRQLRNTMERACIMAADKVIQASDLPESVRGAETVTFQTPITSLGQIEKAHILRVLEHCGGNKKAAAELLEIDRSTLYAKLRQYGTI